MSYDAHRAPVAVRAHTSTLPCVMCDIRYGMATEQELA